MRILVVGNSSSELAHTVQMLTGNDSSIDIDIESDENKVIALAKINRYNTVFLEAKKNSDSCIGLAGKLHRLNPKTSIIFITDESENCASAGMYLMKPVDIKQLDDAMNIRKTAVAVNGLFVRCFGRFEVFFDGKPVKFARRRAKELFAYLIDQRGVSASTGDMCEILWDGDSRLEAHKGYLRRLISDIRQMLRECDSQDALISGRDSYALNVNNIKCDYYDFLSGDVMRYNGEYMKQYSWAEITHARLDNI